MKCISILSDSELESNEVLVPRSYKKKKRDVFKCCTNCVYTRNGLSSSAAKQTFEEVRGCFFFFFFSPKAVFPCQCLAMTDCSVARGQSMSSGTRDTGLPCQCVMRLINLVGLLLKMAVSLDLGVMCVAVHALKMK